MDDDGNRFTILSTPQRIISTIPSNTEILFLLGLSKNIVGVTTQCNFPSDARTKEKIGDVKINAEKIISLNPDIVFMLGDAQRMEINRLSSYGLPVFVVNPRTVEELLNSIWMIGNATGKEKKAMEIISDMRLRMQKSSAERHGTRPKVLVVLWPQPLVTAGRNTMINDIIWRAGGTNTAARAKGQYPVLSLEDVIKDDPDCIIVAGKSRDDMERLKKTPAFAALRAIKENRVIVIDNDIITRPGPRIIKALDIISTFINNK